MKSTGGGGGCCTGIFSQEKISTRDYFACSPEFAVENFAPTCCEPAFGKASAAGDATTSLRLAMHLEE